MKRKFTILRSLLLLALLSISHLAYNQAPNWIWNSPIVVNPSSVGGTGLSCYAMIDRPGTIYYVLLSHGSTPAPSVAQVYAGTDGSGFTPIAHSSIAINSNDYKSGYKSIEISNGSITANTEYDVYFVAKDTAGTPHFQSSTTMLDLTTQTSSGLNFLNSGFEQWNDSLTVPMYYYNWRQLLPSYQTYSRSTGESGYGVKTTVTNTNLTNKVILDMQEDPFAFGLTTGAKYHVSLRLKASKANVFSAAFKSWLYFNDFTSGSGSPSSATTLLADTLKTTNWYTYSYDFTMTSANRFKARWNVNKLSGVAVGDNVIIDNFYIKKASDAPAWWNGNPTITNVKFNKFDISLALDEPGTVYYVLVNKDATAPSVTEVLNGTAAGALPAIQNGSFDVATAFDSYTTTLTGLTESKNYDLYLVAKNKESSPTPQANVTKVSTLTSAFPGPFAKAGGIIWAIEGYTVTLNGTGSIGTNLSYNWTAPGTITLSSNTVPKPTFTAPAAADTNIYKVVLVVSDSVNVSYPDTVVIHVVHDYTPIANAGANKLVDPGANVSIDGSQSYDPNGNKLTYNWTIPDGITVDKTDTAVISFIATSPLHQTDYKFILVVNDGVLNSAPDTVTITVKKFNLPPSADAGNGKTVDPGSQVVLDGSASTDPNGDALTYHWTVPAEVTVSNVDTSVLKFTAPSPDVKTSYKFILVVNDGTVDSSPDTVVLTVNAIHHKPKANAGADQTVNPGDQVVLTGSYTADSTGKKPSFNWIVPNGITVSKSDTAVISFTAPSPATTTVYSFILTVNDGLVNSDPDTVDITVHGTTAVPVNSVQELQIYPNPVSTNLTIRLSSNWSTSANVKIYNALGSLYIERKMEGRENQIDLSSLPSGIYFVEVKDGVNTISRKLIKR